MFKNIGLPLSEAGLAKAAGDIGIGPPALWAVITVETNGCGFLPDRRPRVLFERHLFHLLAQTPEGLTPSDLRPSGTSPGRSGDNLASGRVNTRREQDCPLK